jgi:hypothetical protein
VRLSTFSGYVLQFCVTLCLTPTAVCTPFSCYSRLGRCVLSTAECVEYKPCVCPHATHTLILSCHLCAVCGLTWLQKRGSANSPLPLRHSKKFHCFVVLARSVAERFEVNVICGSGGIAPRILNLGTRWRWVVSFTTRPLSPKFPWYIFG